MKKYITLFFLVAIVGLVSGQNATVAKQKEPFAKDSIKNNKVIEAGQEVALDTIPVKLEKLKLYKKSVIATYYAEKFNGRKTASGKRFSNSGYTAAHKKLPFGTKVKVTNEVNGHSVILEINDRGPFVRSREIDLTKRAFMELAHNKGSGMIKVTIEILEP
jgi:rare lipoprotein A